MLLSCFVQTLDYWLKQKLQTILSLQKMSPVSTILVSKLQYFYDYIRQRQAQVLSFPFVVVNDLLCLKTSLFIGILRQNRAKSAINALKSKSQILLGKAWNPRATISFKNKAAWKCSIHLKGIRRKPYAVLNGMKLFKLWKELEVF